LLCTSVVAAAAPSVHEIAVPAAIGSGEPFLTTDASGRLLLTWLEPVPKSDQTALRFSRFDGNTWSAPRTIAAGNNFFVNWADFPAIAADRSGTLLAHWLQKSGASNYAYDVRFAISRDGGETWGPPALLNRDGKQVEHGFASWVPLPVDGFAATWVDGRQMRENSESGEMSLRYATVSPTGRVLSDALLDSRICECCTTTMAMTSVGPVVAYRDRSENEIRDISVVRAVNGRWTKSMTLHDDGWQINGCPVNGPQMDSRGRTVAVAWFTGANDRGRVYTAFSDDSGATFGKSVAVDDGKPAGRVDLVLLDPSTAIVTWLEQTQSGAEIRARKLSRHASSREPSLKIADSSAARATGFPRMARLGRDIYVAWTEQSASAKRIHLAKVSF
jgi:hypothetical protein